MPLPKRSQYRTYRHPIVIRSTSPTNLDDGSFTETATVRQRWRAHIETMSGRELYEAKSVHSDAKVRVEMPYWPGGLTTSHTITFEDRTFNIVHINNVMELNQTHELLCTEDTTP